MRISISLIEALSEINLTPSANFKTRSPVGKIYPGIKYELQNQKIQLTKA
jgi:hypothetical protein